MSVPIDRNRRSGQITDVDIDVDGGQVVWA